MFETRVTEFLPYIIPFSVYNSRFVKGRSRKKQKIKFFGQKVSLSHLFFGELCCVPLSEGVEVGVGVGS